MVRIRIGGKGMTSNRYVVLNCPTLMGNRLCYGKVTRQCADCTNCVIKQVIEKCKVVYNTERLNRYKTNGFILANDILQLFDIEE